ncbi:uncharacterized protein LOC110441985 [Mizuhopecten yessoensis]|uniref:uncharacterized protein LOC110441985 n=1 Tax=Mizuhopecten yessoensis TaxID=6573 RepID=UPI000B45E469|nr:uncharacterized protein LOC110441985 [Mizuhopecten yessoensis]
MEADALENDGRLGLLPSHGKSNTISVDDDVKQADLLIIPEEQIPIENDICIGLKCDRHRECGAEHASRTGGEQVNIFDEIGYSSFENEYHIESDLLYLLQDEDADLARRVGLIRRTQVDRTPIIPDRKAMRVLLRHIYDVTGEVYEDIPTKYRTSHVSLAIYLKLCTRLPGRRMHSVT